MRKLPAELIEAVKACRDKGMRQQDAANYLGISRDKIRSITTNYNIRGWPVGAAARNQFGIYNPNYKNGVSRGTVNRTTKQVLQTEGRDLFTCERCGNKRDTEQPRHHKDRDRSNNSPKNLEVLCVSCHNREHMHEKERNYDGTWL